MNDQKIMDAFVEQEQTIIKLKQQVRECQREIVIMDVELSKLNDFMSTNYKELSVARPVESVIKVMTEMRELMSEDLVAENAKLKVRIKELEEGK